MMKKNQINQVIVNSVHQKTNPPHQMIVTQVIVDTMTKMVMMMMIVMAKVSVKKDSHGISWMKELKWKIGKE